MCEVVSSSRHSQLDSQAPSRARLALDLILLLFVSCGYQAAVKSAVDETLFQIRLLATEDWDDGKALPDRVARRTSGAHSLIPHFPREKDFGSGLKPYSRLFCGVAYLLAGPLDQASSTID